MSSTNGSVTHKRKGPFCHKRLDNGEDCKWSTPNIFFMVLGFILFWPAGLVMLFWILSGRHVRDLPAAIKEKWSSAFGGKQTAAMSDNVLFNEYQQTQLDRISEIKKEIGDRAQRFQAFRDDAKRREDAKEFDAFMASNPSRDAV